MTGLEPPGSGDEFGDLSMREIVVGIVVGVTIGALIFLGAMALVAWLLV